MSMFRSFTMLATAAVVSLAATGAYAAGDADKGKRVFNRCKACHTLEAGKHRVGPSLAGMFERKAGSADGFNRYSDSLAAADFTWDEEKLMEYLENPRDMFDGSKMMFQVRKESDRADVIAYLKEATK